MQNIEGTNFSISEQLILPDEAPSHAAIINENKKLVSSEITTKELNTLAGINTDRTIQNQLDAIPKYKYLDGQTIVITDEELLTYLGGTTIEDATQEQIDSAMVALGKDKLNNGSLFEEGYSPAQWDAIGLRLERSEKEIFKDAMYYYDTTARWVFLYFLSTTVSRADGTIAGIVENSSDITWANGLGTVKHSQTADKLTPGRNINGTKFDGSADITTAKWGTARTIGVTGELSGSASIDGSKNVNIDVSYVVHGISKNTDLNIYKGESQVGFYKCLSDATAKTLKNSPTMNAFGLEVMSTGAGVRQELTTYGTIQPKKWFRTYYTYNQAWSNWFEIFTESSNPTFYKINNNLPDANHELDLTTEKTFGPEKEITLKGSGERIQSVTALGFTQQAGTGDPSPTNVRALTNGGLKLKRLVLGSGTTFTKEEGGSFSYYSESIGYSRVFAVSNNYQWSQIDASAPKRFDFWGNALYIVDSDYSDANAFNAYLAARYAAGNPVIVWYVPADESQATGLYAPIILQGGEYRATCLPLTAPLCEGDSVVSWARSGCDQQVVLGTTTKFALSGANTFSCGLTYSVIADSKQYSNAYPWSRIVGANGNRFNVAETTLYVVDTNFSTAEEFNAHITALEAAGTPIVVWYRSANYTPAADIPVSLETHQQAVLVLDGTEGWAANAGSAWCYSKIGTTPGKSADGTVVCSQFKGRANVSHIGTNWVTVSAIGYVVIKSDAYTSDTEALSAYLAAQYAAGTPVTIVYELATPITYAHEAAELRAYEDSNNSYTISTQENATVSVTLKPMQAADTLDGFHAKDFMPNTITIIRGRVY